MTKKKLDLKKKTYKLHLFEVSVVDIWTPPHMNTECMVCTSTQPVLDAELLLQLSLCLVLFPSASEVCLFRLKNFNPHFQTPPGPFCEPCWRRDIRRTEHWTDECKELNIRTAAASSGRLICQREEKYLKKCFYVDFHLSCVILPPFTSTVNFKSITMQCADFQL